MRIFNWICPHCNHAATITEENYYHHSLTFNRGIENEIFDIKTFVTVCPNEECKQYAIRSQLQKMILYGGSPSSLLMSWQLLPSSHAKPFPDYIPEAIRKDYEEACLIQDLSPKASATLSRRCLQGIIRDYWNIVKSRLIDEINALQGKIEQKTWEAIDAVRKFGNIGAHMEKDINVIIEVEPKEADLLIGLIEILLQDWYIARHEREQHLESLIAAAKDKKPRSQMEVPEETTEEGNALTDAATQ